MSEETLLQHVFISYSRRDLKFADRLVADLEKASIPVWIDRSGVGYEDRSFEREIREALNASFAVVLIASPDSYESDYVQGELDNAKSKKLTLFVVWAKGENYTDAVPTYLSRQTYFDFRGDNYEQEIGKLQTELKKVKDEKLPRFALVPLASPFPRSHLSIKVSDTQKAIIAPDRFDTTRKFLDVLYMEALQQTFPPMTYGKKWIIASVAPLGRIMFRSVMLPAQWLTENKPNTSVVRHHGNWFNQPLNGGGLNPMTQWEVLPTEGKVIFGVVTTDRYLKQALESLTLPDLANQNDAQIILEKYLAYSAAIPQNPAEVEWPKDKQCYVVMTESVDPFSKYHRKIVSVR